MALRIACVVLAAGEGRRFGGVKQLARVGGRTLLETALATVHAVPALDPVVCVLGAHADAIRDEVDLSGVQVVLAEDWADGQSASLKAGVAAVAGADAVLVVLADQPGITPIVIEGTLRAYDTDWHDAVRPVFTGRPGNPVLLGPKLLAWVPELVGDTGARDLLRGYRVHTWDATALADPTDIDTPENLEVFTP